MLIGAWRKSDTQFYTMSLRTLWFHFITAPVPLKHKVTVPVPQHCLKKFFFSESRWNVPYIVDNRIKRFFIQHNFLKIILHKKDVVAKKKLRFNNIEVYRQPFYLGSSFSEDDFLYKYIKISSVFVNMLKSQQFWVRHQHPPTQWNLRGGRWSSVA